MHRLLGFLLLLTPLSCLKTLSSNQLPAETTQPLQTWNRDNLPWGTVLIWTERPTGNSLTTGVLINKAKRWVLATRHALDNAQPDRPSTGMSDTVYVVWPAVEPESGQLLKTSDHYFRQRRSGQLQPARVLAEDAARDIVLLQAGTSPPETCREIPLETGSVPPGTPLIGMAQPFTRGGLWHPFSASVLETVHRRLSYAPPERPENVTLYVARGEEPAEFGYSGAPLVLPHSGKLVGLLLAAQVDKPLTYVLISSQEIRKLLPIE